MFTKNWYRIESIPFHDSGYTAKSIGMVNFNNAAISGSYASAANQSLLSKNNYCPYIGRLTTNASLGYEVTGVIIGSGTTPPTIDDYKLENRITLSGITSSGSVSTTSDDGGITLISVLTIANNSGQEITIGECGIFTNNGSTGDAYCALIERTVLESPITIPAGGVGQVTYTIRMNHITA